jgi:hypothetical protein
MPARPVKAGQRNDGDQLAWPALAQIVPVLRIRPRAGNIVSATSGNGSLTPSASWASKGCVATPPPEGPIRRQF